MRVSVISNEDSLFLPDTVSDSTFYFAILGKTLSSLVKKIVQCTINQKNDERIRYQDLIRRINILEEKCTIN